MRTFPGLSSLLLLAVVASCGGSGGGSSTAGKQNENNGFSQNETIRADGSNVAGLYGTPLWSVNYNLHVPKVGYAAVRRTEDEFWVKLKMNVGPRDTQVRQGIYFGRRCPELKDDLNKDAFIDAEEAKRAMGLMTIPLDGDLNGQDAGSNQFPYGRSRNGSYVYEEAASFQRLFDDLKVPETNFDDDVMKIMPQDGITLPGRVVLVMGIEPDYVLPPTVQGAYGMSAHESMPIACGVLWKVKKLPSEIQ